MGSLTSSCVRDCVRTTHEYASEDPLHQPVEQLPGMASSSSHAPADSKVGRGPVVPPVPNWFQVLQDGRRNREGPMETPRFDEVLRSPGAQDQVMMTPRGSDGGEFRTPGPSPRTPMDSPRGDDMTAIESSYEGTYLGTLKHGTGKLRMQACTYEGGFANDMKHGNGTLRWDDGRLYRGQFENGKFHGSATMMWPDGRKYTGQYNSDRKHGEGTFSWQDGRCYQGQWVAGKRHGVGVYTNAKGFTRRGLWQMDRPLQWDAVSSPEEQTGGSAQAALAPERPNHSDGTEPQSSQAASADSNGEVCTGMAVAPGPGTALDPDFAKVAAPAQALAGGQDEKGRNDVYL